MEAPYGFGDWQSALTKILSKLEGHNSFIDFAHLKTNRERVEFVVRKKLLRGVKWLPLYFEASEKWHCKSDTEAQMWKNKGNKFFQQRKYKEAALSYTQCCVHASAMKGDLLALGYGNRSAALYHLDHFEDCITDVDRAITQGVPHTSKHKLLLRKMSAAIKLGQIALAKEALDKLKEFIDSEEFCLTGEKRDAFMTEVHQLEKDINTGTNTSDKSEKNVNNTTCENPIVYRGTNDIVTQASRAVTLSYTPEKTRHLVANENIPQGSTIIVENPFSAILLPDFYESHCHQCFRPLPLTAVGCDRCSHILFCSDSCRSVAYEKYHRTECPYLDLLHSVGIAHLSLRTVLLAGKKFLSDFLSNPSKYRPKNGESNEIKGINSQGEYGRNYLTVHDLMTHEETTAPQDMLQYSLTAALLLCTLLHSGHFDDMNLCEDKTSSFDKESLLSHFLTGKSLAQGESTGLPPHIMEIGGLLLQHILQLICNAHAITSLVFTKTSQGIDISSNVSVDEQEQVRIATAIYPTASLMNHSCDPTIVSSFLGDLLVVKTVKTVAKDEGIFNCYGPHSRRMKREDRQEVLHSQYHFVCQCSACLSNDVCQQRFGAFKCSLCSDILSNNLCVGCGYMESTDYISMCEKTQKEMDANFEEALKMMAKDNQEALKLLLNCQRERKRIYYRDHRSLAFGEDAIARCYANLGDFSSSADHLYTSVEFASLMYGSESIEYGHELQKLAEVLFNAERFSECLDISTKASQLLTNVYCHGHKILSQIHDLKLAAETALTPMMHAQ